MADQPVQFLHGRAGAALRLPSAVVLLTGKAIPALPDAPAAVRDALDHPIGAPPLVQIARDRSPHRVAVTISDITRPVPNQVLLEAILERLRDAGIGDDRVVIVIATGMHRPSTAAERVEMLGQALLERVEVIDHVADDAASLVQVSDDPPVSVNRRFVEADLKIVTGLIEPHFMAGFSGGRKGICPGLVDLRTVQRFHGYQVMADPRSVEGMLAGNPCHAEAMRVAKLVGCDFLVNVAITHGRQPAGVYAGDMVEAHLAGCAQVAKWNTARVEKPFDLVVTCGGGYPLDASFYQTVKGMVTALPALGPTSTLLILSDCRVIGSPEYEATMMQFGGDHRGFLSHIAAAGTVVKDQWQYQMHARVLDRIGVDRLLLAGDGLPQEVQRRLAVTPAPGDGDAAGRAQAYVDQFVREYPAARIAAIPQGPYTMLRRASSAG